LGHGDIIPKFQNYGFDADNGKIDATSYKWENFKSQYGITAMYSDATLNILAFPGHPTDLSKAIRNRFRI
jgi:hypothetical protein